MKTIKEHSEAKEKLFDAAQKIMLTKGFLAASVEEICDEAKLTKGCFFHYFDTKEDLGKELLERYLEGEKKCAHDATFRKETDSLKRVYGLIDYMIEKFQDSKGCLIGTFTQELSDTHPGIRKICEKAFQGLVEVIKSDLDAAKAQYLPQSHLDTKSLAEHFVSVLEGSIILAKARQDHAVVKTSLSHFKNYIKTIFGR